MGCIGNLLNWGDVGAGSNAVLQWTWRIVGRTGQGAQKVRRIQLRWVHWRGLFGLDRTRWWGVYMILS